MDIKRLFFLFAVMFSVFVASISASAASKKAFDIYSWPQEGTANYCYAILPSSKEARQASEIKAAKDQVCGGSGDLKRIVGQAAPIESKLYWKVDVANGLVLPTRDIVNDFQRFSLTIPYKLVVSEPK